MPIYPDELPPQGENFYVTLTNGVTLMGYYDGTTWWCGVDGQPDDVPVANQYVVRWETSPPQ